MNSATRDRRYFVSLPIDVLLVGGASLLCFALFSRSPSFGGAHTLVAAGILTAAFNWPHFSATNFRLYGSRATLLQYPATAIGAPLICGAAVIGSLASPLLVAPLFLKLFLLWSPFHYSGQTVGVTFIYARRTGLVLGRFTRLAVVAFVYLSFLAPSAASEAGIPGRSYSGILVPSFGIAPWIPPVLRTAMLASGALALMMITIASVRARRFPSAMILLPAISQYVWFVPGNALPSFRELVPLFHSLQYLLIAWAMDLHESAARGGEHRGYRFVLTRTARWAGLNLAGGALLLWALPRAVGADGLSAAATAAVVAAGVQVHHFFVDGVIWKLKSSAVSSPLLGTVGDLLPPAPEKPPPLLEPVT